MLRREDELEQFKTRINLSEYAAAQGYYLDRKASSRNSAVMRDRHGDKVVIARGIDHHWIYFSVRNDRDSGSIIDFVQFRKGSSLGEVRKLLRPWINAPGPASRPSKSSFSPPLDPISRDTAKVRARFEACSEASHHPYLENERKIPADILQNERFSGRVRIDERDNAIFPHFGRDGVCGFEIKNRNFTGFSPGGEKGLWCSRIQDDDTALVIAETAIDALSYAALKPDSTFRYVSTAGEMSAAQSDLLKSAFEKLPKGARIILAMDNDAGGDHLIEKIQGLFSDLKLAEVVLVIDRPQGRGQDLNDVLRADTAKKEHSGPQP